MGAPEAGHQAFTEPHPDPRSPALWEKHTREGPAGRTTGEALLQGITIRDGLLPTGEGLGPLDIARPPPPPLQREPGAGGLEGSRIAAQGFCHSPGTPVLLCKAFLPALLPSGDLTSCVIVTVSQLGSPGSEGSPQDRPVQTLCLPLSVL